MTKKWQIKSKKPIITEADGANRRLARETNCSADHPTSNKSVTNGLVNFCQVASNSPTSLSKHAKMKEPLRRSAPYTVEEDLEIIEMYQKLGRKWKLISSRFNNKSRAAMRAHAYSLIKKVFKKLAGSCRMFRERRQLRRISFNTFDRFLKTTISPSIDQVKHISLYLGKFINTPLDLVKIVIANEKHALELFTQNDHLRQLAEGQIAALVNLDDFSVKLKTPLSELSPVVECPEQTDQSHPPLRSENDCNLFNDRNFSEILMLHFFQENRESTHPFAQSVVCLDKISFLETLHRQITLCNNTLFALSSENPPKFVLSGPCNKLGTVVDTKFETGIEALSSNYPKRTIDRQQSISTQSKSNQGKELNNHTVAFHVKNKQTGSKDKGNQTITLDPKCPSKIYRTLERFHLLSTRDNLCQASWLNGSFDSKSAQEETMFDQGDYSYSSEFDVLP